MMTVNEVNKLTGVSIRTLQYYDKIGLLSPTSYTESGHRLYDDTALEQQIELLLLKKEHIEHLISLARGIKSIGGTYMNFKAFDTKKMDDYAKQAKESWGNTDAYKEFEVKNKNRTSEENKDLGRQLMAILAEFGTLKGTSASNPIVQTQVKKIQDFISVHYYTCTDTILSQLGLMYTEDDDFTANIDEAGGIGTAKFIYEAIQAYCKK